MAAAAASRMPTVYVAHGGGPMPLMGADDKTREHLASVSRLVGSRPKAIVVITAHWESAPLRVSGGESTSLLFDYYGFPAETYEYEYRPPAEPRLAQRVQSLLKAQKIPCDLDSTRGLDHGVFVPLMLAYPDADVPVVALSLHAGLDPATHLRMGEALAPLRDEGILLLASGMSFHNMRAFSRHGSPREPVGRAFDDALGAALLESDDTGRKAKLRQWTALRGARDSHPREEHFLPLLVAAGAADAADRPRRIFNDVVLGAQVSAFLFEPSETAAAA